MDLRSRFVKGVFFVQVCQRMKELRKEKGLSQKKIADVLGVLYQQYARYENGEREIPLHHAVTLAKFYGVSLDYLVGMTDER